MVRVLIMLLIIRVMLSIIRFSSRVVMWFLCMLLLLDWLWLWCRCGSRFWVMVVDVVSRLVLVVDISVVRVVVMIRLWMLFGRLCLIILVKVLLMFFRFGSRILVVILISVLVML